jgi:uncharacterized membrane protein
MAAHFCAPMFVFLTGLSAWLYAHPAGGPRNATGFLVKRGLLLVVLELVPSTSPGPAAFPPPVLYLQVIWVIGLAMIVLAWCTACRWPAGRGSLAIVGGHNALASAVFAPGSLAAGAWTVLEQRGFLVEGAVKRQGHLSAAALDRRDPARLRLRSAVRARHGAGRAPPPADRGRQRLPGAARAAARFQLYGEALPWSVQEDALRTAMSFLNFTKYPPSLDFLLLTLGCGVLALAWLERVDNVVHALPAPCSAGRRCSITCCICMRCWGCSA